MRYNETREGDQDSASRNLSQLTVLDLRPVGRAADERLAKSLKQLPDADYVAG